MKITWASGHRPHRPLVVIKRCIQPERPHSKTWNAHFRPTVVTQFHVNRAFGSDITPNIRPLTHSTRGVSVLRLIGDPCEGRAPFACQANGRLRCGRGHTNALKPMVATAGEFRIPFH